MLGIDSLRPDHLIRNGYSHSIAPHVEGFLDNSVVFANAYTPLARTFPSWMSILTGKYPMETGIRYNLMQRHYYQNDQPTLSEFLQKKHGYYSIHSMDETRFCNIVKQDGFDDLMHPVTGVVDFLLGSFHDFSFANLYLNNRVGGFFFPFIKNNRAISHLYDGKFFVTDIEKKIDSLKDTEQFFLAVHLCAAHWPYTLRGNKSGSGDDFSKPHYRYQEAIKLADNQLGHILGALKRNGLYDNSVIVMFSDHGESFESHWGHGTSLHDTSQNHIVLAVKPVGYDSHDEDTQLVSTVDIAPTVLNLLGMDTLPAFSGEALFAEDQVSIKNRNNRPIFMETGFHLFHSFGEGFPWKKW